MNISQSTLSARARRGKFDTAQLIDGIWYIDEDEIISCMPPKDKEGNPLIRLTDCCDKLGIPKRNINNFAAKGNFETAILYFNKWYISQKEVDEILTKTKDLIRYSDYCKMYHLKPASLAKYLKDFKSVCKINGLIYIDKNEKPPMNNEPLPSNYVTLKEYADLYNIKLITLQKSVQSGKYKSAVKRLKTWYIDKYEPCHNIVALTKDC